jgi:hypothetical protein
VLSSSLVLAAGSSLWVFDASKATALTNRVNVMMTSEIEQKGRRKEEKEEKREEKGREGEKRKYMREEIRKMRKWEESSQRRGEEINDEDDDSPILHQFYVESPLAEIDKTPCAKNAQRDEKGAKI